MNDEIALTFITLVKVLLRVDFEHIITHLESHWLHFRCYIFTWLLDVAEGFVRFAVKIRECRGPFLTDFLKYIRWDGKLGTSGINNSRVASVLSW